MIPTPLSWRAAVRAIADLSSVTRILLAVAVCLVALQLWLGAAGARPQGALLLAPAIAVAALLSGPAAAASAAGLVVTAWVLALHSPAGTDWTALLTLVGAMAVAWLAGMALRRHARTPVRD